MKSENNHMRKITVLSMITLDGVMQAPGGPEEDREDGFEYGGWVAPFSDEMYSSVVQKELQPADYLLGRKTYEIWAAYWPHHGNFWPGINEGTKYVFSNTITKESPLVQGWQNSIVISDIDDIRKLKQSEGKDIQVWGSSQLVHLLLQHDMVDELRLKIHPLLLGRGKKLFDNNATPAAFELAENKVTSKGVMIATYKRNGEVKTGNVGV